jgi:amidase
MGFTGPTITDLQEAADRLGLQTLTDETAGIIRDTLGNAVSALARLDAMPDPVAPGADMSPRSPGRAPTDAENPHGAWAWLGPITGSGKGLLAGKSVGVKDNTLVRGLPLRNGSQVLDGFIADADATVVTRILAAGGTIAGKTVCENLSYSGHSHTSWPNRVQNPRKHGFAAGGSSSGSAAVIAAGDVPMALGCDQGGSIRIPAAWCGVVGLKPTHGLVPYTGICALESSIDHVGPMGATVEDVARLLTVIAGPDGLDPRQPATLEPVDYLAAIGEGLRGLRIGLVTQGFGRPESDPATDAAVRDALSRMQAAGAEVEDISVPAHEDMFDIWNAICIEGTAALMFGAGTGGYAEGHVSMPLLDAFAQGWRARPEALSASATMTLVMGEHLQHRYHGRYFAKAQALRGAVRAAYTKAFGRCDVVAMPTVPFPALPMPPTQATFGEMLKVALPMIGNTAALNASGHPAVSVPVALRDGLPVGLMLIGRHFQDALTLRAAAGLEALGDWQTW